MKKVVVGLLLLMPSISFACPSLDGTWSSSKEKFVEFNKRWANVETKAWNYMLQSQGVETIEFISDGNMVIHTPEAEFVIGEKKTKKPASTEKINFSVLGCNATSMVLKYQRYGKTQISQLHFENDNTYWEYMGKPGRSGNGHIREYYTKIQ